MGSDDYFSMNSNLLCFVCVCVSGGGGVGGGKWFGWVMQSNHSAGILDK